MPESSSISEYQIRKQYREARKTYQVDYLVYSGMMVGCGAAMPAHEKESLEKWEAENLDGCTVGTSDWPGWEKYIGSKPVPPENPFPPKQKIQISTKLRVRVFVRDSGKCVKCGSEENLQADHVIPESRGGPTTLENLQTLCGPCNSKKGAK